MTYVERVEIKEWWFGRIYPKGFEYLHHKYDAKSLQKLEKLKEEYLKSKPGELDWGMTFLEFHQSADWRFAKEIFSNA